MHCSQGVSRSAALAIAFLMWQSQRPYEQVFAEVKAIRGIANPNIGFTCQVCAQLLHVGLRSLRWSLSFTCQVCQLELSMPCAVPNMPEVCWVSVRVKVSTGQTNMSAHQDSTVLSLQAPGAMLTVHGWIMPVP